MTRTLGGNPTINGEVVPADAIALLSGVNFSAVAKVLAAIELIAEHAGMSSDLLCYLDDIPLDRVIVGEPEYNFRASKTREFVQSLADEWHGSDAGELLHLRGRFPP